jgi:hypothetical protein
MYRLFHDGELPAGLSTLKPPKDDEFGRKGAEAYYFSKLRREATRENGTRRPEIVAAHGPKSGKRLTSELVTSHLGGIRERWQLEDLKGYENTTRHELSQRFITQGLNYRRDSTTAPKNAESLTSVDPVGFGRALRTTITTFSFRLMYMC